MLLGIRRSAANAPPPPGPSPAHHLDHIPDDLSQQPDNDVSIGNAITTVPAGDTQTGFLVSAEPLSALFVGCKHCWLATTTVGASVSGAVMLASLNSKAS